MFGRLNQALAGDLSRHGYAEDYLAALAALGAGGFRVAVDALPTGPRAFYHFFDGLSEETVADRTLSIYAPEAWFNDTLKTTRGAANIRDYFLETLERVEELRVEVLEAVGRERSWYFRWTMMMRFESLNGGQPMHSVGTSHILFDTHDQVVVHQDFWDSGTWFFTAVPLAGKIIDRVKRGL